MRIIDFDEPIGDTVVVPKIEDALARAIIHRPLQMAILKYLYKSKRAHYIEEIARKIGNVANTSVNYAMWNLNESGILDYIQLKKGMDTRRAFFKIRDYEVVEKLIEKYHKEIIAPMLIKNKILGNEFVSINSLNIPTDFCIRYRIDRDDCIKALLSSSLVEVKNERRYDSIGYRVFVRLKR